MSLSVPRCVAASPPPTPGSEILLEALRDVEEERSSEEHRAASRVAGRVEVFPSLATRVHSRTKEEGIRK